MPQLPETIKYEGQVWDVDAATFIQVAERDYPVVDYDENERGAGFVVRAGGRDVLIDVNDLDAYRGEAV